MPALDWLVQGVEMPLWAVLTLAGYHRVMRLVSRRVGGSQ